MSDIIFTDENGFDWHDATSYSRDQKNKTPTAFHCNLHFKRPIRIYITNGHIYYKGEWVYSCYELGVSSPRLLKATTKELAAMEAMQDCREIVKDFVKMLKIKP